MEYASERASILEFDAGMPRAEAERQAVHRAILKYRLTEFYGNPPIQGGGTVIGDVGETIEDLENHLREKYGSRLV